MTGMLADITVLDFTRNLAGPFCTMILGDMGANVMKVEIPPYGDDFTLAYFAEVVMPIPMLQGK